MNRKVNTMAMYVCLFVCMCEMKSFVCMYLYTYLCMCMGLDEHATAKRNRWGWAIDTRRTSTLLKKLKTHHSNTDHTISLRSANHSLVKLQPLVTSRVGSSPYMTDQFMVATPSQHPDMWCYAAKWSSPEACEHTVSSDPGYTMIEIHSMICAATGVTWTSVSNNKLRHEKNQEGHNPKTRESNNYHKAQDRKTKQ